MTNYLTQIQVAPAGGFQGYGILGGTSGSGAADAPNVFAKFISSTIGLITIIGIIWTIITLMTGAIGYITSGGDKASVEAARKKMTHGLIGLVIIIVSMFIIGLAGSIFGIDFLNFLSLFNTLI